MERRKGLGIRILNVGHARFRPLRISGFFPAWWPDGRLIACREASSTPFVPAVPEHVAGPQTHRLRLTHIT